jgi:RNA recognition motif-containing protein
MNNRLYIGNLPYNIAESDLAETFGEHGEVLSASIITDRDTGRSKGFGFVEMGTDDEATAAMEALNGTQFGGRTLRVDRARPRERR